MPSEPPPAEKKSSHISAYPTGKPIDILAALQTDADAAAAFAKYVETLLQGSNAIEALYLAAKPPVAFGQQYQMCLAHAANLHIRFRLAIGTGMPPNPSFTKEGFLQFAGSMFDTLDSYHTVQQQEREADGKSKS